jgi:hypothetical protein
MEQEEEEERVLQEQAEQARIQLRVLVALALLQEVLVVELEPLVMMVYLELLLEEEVVVQGQVHWEADQAVMEEMGEWKSPIADLLSM